MTRALLNVTALVTMVACGRAVAQWQARSSADSKEAPSRPVKFTRDIRPILARHCFACHGPDENQRKAKLRLDLKEGAFAEQDGSRPFVPGSADESEALRRISRMTRRSRCPRAAKEKRLAPEQVELLKHGWDKGRNGNLTGRSRSRPGLPFPSSRMQTWPRNPIDHFVLARLEREGLSPSPEADRRHLDPSRLP